MKRTMAIRSLMLGGMLGTMGLTACGPSYETGRVVAVQAPPPPMRAEYYGVAPAPGYVWVAGYWQWGGADYVWAPGYWARPPRATYIWVPARWERRGPNWHFREGRWRKR